MSQLRKLIKKIVIIDCFFEPFNKKKNSLYTYNSFKTDINLLEEIDRILELSALVTKSFINSQTCRNFYLDYFL